MKIILITWNYPPKTGGMEMMMYQLVQHLSPYADIDVIGPFSQEKHREKEKSTVQRPKGGGLVWFFLYSFFKGFSLTMRNRYDVIIAGSALLLPVTLLLAKIYRRKAVVNVYGLDLIYPNLLYQWMIKKLLPLCDMVIAISAAAKQEAIKKGVETSKIQIIPPGTSFSEFAHRPEIDDVREKYGLKDRFVILSAGRLARRKGILEFIENSLPAIVAANPEVLFLVAGDNPVQSLSHKEDIKQLIEQAISRLGLAEHVQLLGRVRREELIKLYFVCDLFVLPGINVPGDMEGFGIVILEANSVGKPVVAADIGGIGDAVDDKVSGMLVTAEDWSGFTSTINHLIENPAIRQELGGQGKRRVESEYDWPKIGKKYIETLKRKFSPGNAVNNSE